jgi:hypothetical protein
MRIDVSRPASVVVVAVSMCCTAAFAHRAAAESQVDPAPGPAHVVDTGELMDLVVLPTYQELQRAMATPAATRQDWGAIYKAAVRLAEMENLLFFREPNRYTTNPEFPRFAEGARRAAIAVVNATMTGLVKTTPEDYAAVQRAYAGVSSSCNACHRGLNTMNGATIKP